MSDSISKGDFMELKYLDFPSLYIEHLRMLTATIYQFSVIYILPPPRNTITLYTFYKCTSEVSFTSSFPFSMSQIFK